MPGVSAPQAAGVSIRVGPRVAAVLCTAGVVSGCFCAAGMSTVLALTLPLRSACTIAPASSGSGSVNRAVGV